MEGVDYSGTNNQENGVDEADFVKTNGYNIFFVDDGVLHIMDIPKFGEIEHASTTEVQGNPVAMMLNNHSLVVVSTVSSWNIADSDPLQDAMGWSGDWYGWRTNSLTKFTVYNISDSSSPEVDRELYIEGYYMTAREVAGTVRTVTHSWMNIPDLRTWLTYPIITGVQIILKRAQKHARSCSTRRNESQYRIDARINSRRSTPPGTRTNWK